MEMKITEKGTKIIMEKYGLYPNTFYYWKRKFKDAGADGLDHGMTKERLAKIKKLE